MNPWYLQYMNEQEGDGGDGGGADTTPPAADDAPPPAATAEGGDPPQLPAQDWADDWRQKISTDDKHAKTLERFGSPKNLFESYMALRQKVDSGELKAGGDFPDKGTPEQQAEWRKTQGIPDTPEGYELALGDGLVIGEADKPLVDGFLGAAHAANASPEQVNKLLGWYYGEQERMVDEQQSRDAEYLKESEDALRAEWGGEFRANINMIKGLVDTMPADVKDLFLTARLGDGNALLNHPDMARWLVMNARTINPVATVVPGAGANVAGAIDDEISAIEKTMRTNRAEYNKDEKMQKRLRDLYSARERAQV